MRRALFLLILLSACAPTHVPLPPPGTLARPPQAPPPQPAPQPTPPAPQPQPVAPPIAPAAPTVTQPAALGFEAWRDGFIEKAVAKGFDRTFVTEALAGVQPVQKILSRDTSQPDTSRTISDYVRSAVSPARVAEGVRRRDGAHFLPAVAQKYGVPADILVAIWGQESGFGKVQGDNDVIAAFATLAWDGRRRAWAEDELLDALTILRDRGIARSTLKGSWAGAMGQTQFIPSAYLNLGQDGDGDGKVDIWTSDADALASAANHLAKEGWKPGESWAVEVTAPPGFDWSLAEGEKQVPAWWASKGLRRADGRPWSAADAMEGAVLLVPAGADGPAFLAFPNHFVIRKYNNSLPYALSIGLMADAMEGRSLVRPWPKEVPLSRDDRLAAQTALKALGYPVGTVDGLIGAGTRVALRQWQKSKGLIADGYLTPDMVRRLRDAAHLPAAGPVTQ